MNDVCEICGVPVSLGDLDSHVRLFTDPTLRADGAWLLTLNTEMLARGVREPDYWNLVKKADVITADGMPLVWASRIKSPKMPIPGRTTGVDLVDAILRGDAVAPYAVIGGKSPLKTIERYGRVAVEACKYVFDGRVDMSADQLDLFCRELSLREVQVVFIALGVPKQDQLALALRERMPRLMLTGIGGTFEILGPEGSRAPQWMQKTGLEWAFRLFNEPGRLWRRYLVHYPRGVWALLKDCVALGR